MWGYEERKKAYDLFLEGKNQTEIGKILNISRGTIKDWFKLFKNGDLFLKHGKEILIEELIERIDRTNYSYILAVYLSDGHISKLPRTYRLRLFQDKKYSLLTERWLQALKILFPNNNPFIYNAKFCNEIQVCSNLLPLLFPQHGEGRKNKREIRLEPWQNTIINEHPLEFIKGSIESDGCRYLVTPKPGKGKPYIRYQFTNYSKDIRDIFKKCCDIANIGYAHSNEYKNIYINKIQDVNFLETFIGPKS